MHTKNLISFTHKTVRSIILLVVFLSSFVTGNLPTVHAQGGVTETSVNAMVYDTALWERHTVDKNERLSKNAGSRTSSTSELFIKGRAVSVPDEIQALAGTNLLQDPSFEAYSPNPYWSEASTNYGTPLCSIVDCGDGGGTAGPRTGSVWSWFGGIDVDETASLSQSVTFPNGSAYLEFYLWIGSADAGSDTADMFNAEIDGVAVFSANATQTSSYPTYTLVSVDVSAYADGAAHTVTFSSVTTGQIVTFNLDDVALTDTPTSPPGTFVKTSPANGANGQSTNPTLSWSSSSGASSYEYCYDTTNDNACSSWVSTGITASANVSGLNPGVTYYWQVRANNIDGTTYANGSSIAYWSFVTADTTPPGVFSKTSPSNSATNQPASLTLSWGASSGVASYEYCYDATNDNTCSNWVSTGTITSANVSGLNLGSTYYWQVRAKNSNGTTYANGSSTAYWSFSVTTEVFWSGTTNQGQPISFNVNSSGTQWSTFKLKIVVSGCGLTMEITSYGPGGITNSQFSQSGSFSFTGHFTSASTASGTYSFTNFTAGSCTFSTSGGTWSASLPLPPGSTFGDVPSAHPYHDDIEILYANGYTGGCSTSPLKFCPDVSMSRAQAAVFMLRGNYGSSYTPPSVQHIFADNWVNSSWGEGWAEGMYKVGLTAGCSPSPLQFCPDEILTNVQVAVFGLRLKYGNAYTPPAGTGTVFADLTDIGFWGTGWAEQAYADGLLPACGTSGGKPKFCPNALVTRGFGASVIVKAKNLTMP